MNEIVSAWEEQQAELDGLINPVDDDAWARPSRCDGWSVSDVVLHLAQTNEMALASLQGRFNEVLTELTTGLPPSKDVDDGAGMMVEHQRGAPPVAVYERWKTGIDELRKAFASVDERDKVQWVVGSLSARTLCTTRLAETWIHTNDVASGLGVTLPAAERLNVIANLAWRTLPYAFQRAGRTMTGPVAFELTGASGAPVTIAPADGDALTVVRGTVLELCEVAGQRKDASATSLTAEGPDAESVLELVRTFA
jgi:uncharacterized protein (TIGR03084 family)